MRKLLVVLMSLLVLGLSAPSSTEACKKGAPAKNPSHVKGYTKKSGGAVRAHTRTRVKKYGKSAKKGKKAGKSAGSRRKRSS